MIPGNIIICDENIKDKLNFKFETNNAQTVFIMSLIY